MKRHACIPVVLVLALAGCNDKPPADRVRASGQVEATDVKVAALVGGRLIDLRVKEGDRVNAGDVIARIDTGDTELLLARGQADREQADAQLRLLQAGSRPEDIRQAQAQVASAESEVSAVQAEVSAAQADVDRFESLLASNSGSRKQRDDAVTRRDVAAARLQGARDRVRAASANLAKIRSGARAEEIAAARARVNAADAQIATLQKAVADAAVGAPITGFVTETLAEAGEIVQPRAPILVITDLDRAWANVYVDEPSIPQLRVGQAATVFTDAGGPGLPGSISAIAEKAEFTPRNVQTAEDRSKLVYRVKISVDNTGGTLKSGMPVEAEIPLSDDVIVLNGVGKRYGQTIAVQDLSLSVARQEMFGLIGPDGAGKTTTIRMICGLLAADSGSARVLGLDPVREHRKLTDSVGYLSQRFSLYGDLTIDENIAFFAEIHNKRDYHSRRDRLLDMTQLTPFRKRLAEQLSGGMKQKLALACTLVHEPALIVLDEPTTGVDPVSRREFWKLLSEFRAQGITIVMSTPYLDEAERCSRVALMSGGRLLALDRPEALSASLPGRLFEVIVSEPRKAAKALTHAAGIADVQMFGGRAHIRMTDARAATAAALQTQLESAGLTVSSVRPIQTTLEDVFISRLNEARS